MALVVLEFCILSLLFFCDQMYYFLLSRGGDDGSVVLQSDLLLRILGFGLILTIARIYFLNYPLLVLIIHTISQDRFLNGVSSVVKTTIANVFTYLLFLFGLYLIEPDILRDLLPIKKAPMGNFIYLIGLTVLISPYVLDFLGRKMSSRSNNIRNVG